MILIPIILVLGALALYLAGLLTDTVPLLILAIVCASLAGLAIAALSTLRKATAEHTPAGGQAAASGGLAPPAASPLVVYVPVQQAAPPEAGSEVSGAEAAAEAAMAAAPLSADYEQFAPDATPIAGYDSLRAADVVAIVRSNGLPREALEAMRDYEQSHAARKTVLNAVDSQLGRLPS